MIVKARKKPVEIEAIQYTDKNLLEVLNFTGKHDRFYTWFADEEEYKDFVAANNNGFKIFTLEGTMTAYPGDWIIKGVNGEFYPCKDDIFQKTYELIE